MASIRHYGTTVRQVRSAPARTETEITMTATDLFPRDIHGLPAVAKPSLHRLRDGDRLTLEIAPVVKRIGDSNVRMIAYNGSIPGPTLHVDQGSEITVDVVNNGDVETTVHWHGIRLDNRYDGVPNDTQAPIEIGQAFSYRVTFPDPGFYWYHPHLREDYGQEMGMYGTIIVEPADPTYWPRVDRQLSVTLDDVLIEDGLIAPFSRSGPTFTAMGRFGNVLLINGEERLSAEVALGDVVRLHLVNTANTRIFNVAIPEARMKLVGGDSGRYQRETFVDEVRLAPSERAIVDVLFDRAGLARFLHRTRDQTHELGGFTVASTNSGYEVLRIDPDLTKLGATLGSHRERAPEKTLAFRSTMPLLYGADDGAASGFSCPMHPEVTSGEPGRCPKCGMKLTASTAPGSTYACPMHPEVTSSEPGRCPKCGMKLTAVVRSIHQDDHGARDVVESRCACPMHPEVTGSGPTECPKCGMWLKPIVVTAPDAASLITSTAQHGAGSELDGDGLEWEDLMPDINRESNPANMLWCLTDLDTGAENGDISWNFTVGDRVKIRLVNELESDHPMHHPFHIHGAGRFLVLSRDGAPDPNLVWKDTVLVPAGQTVDILLEVTNPGRWMAHCHIAEHIESGMMFSFDVAPSAEMGSVA
jgi:FtsP/CotA-like multicopper oxidase with cupredoxin domain